jgi:hypothetical protein
MYSALRASLQLFKFDPIEFSPLRYIQAVILPTKVEYFGKLHGEGLFPVKLAEDSFTDRVD